MTSPKMTCEKIITGTVILADRIIEDGFVAITQGQVVAVGTTKEALPEAAEYLDFHDHYIFPGAIDAQVHSRSQKGNEDFIWSSKAAAAGGVTTIVDMPYDAGRLICNAELFNLKKEEAKVQTRVDFALYGTVHPEEGKKHLAAMAEAGAIGFKFSSFGTDAQRFPRIPPHEMYECFSEISRLGLLAGVHNENDESVKFLIDKLQKENITDYRAHNLSRPIYTENIASAEVYELGAETGCRAHIVHCSNGRGIELCKSYRDQGYDVTVETCLHYLTLSEEEDVARLVGRAKINPPVRQKAEREALWQHLEQGNITVLSTDHVSWSLDRKQSENMFENASGASGLELLVTLALTGAEQRNISFTHLAKVLSYNAARLFRLDNCKGALECGKDADLIIIKRDPYIYSAAESGNNFSPWSPYDGREVFYRVVRTMLRGEWIFADNQVIAAPGNGQFVSPLTRRQEPEAC
jgi:allantoinase